jgi:hypothetical protein
VIDVRATRLVRVADLQAFRAAAITLACEGSALDARDRIVVLPTRAAAAHFLRSLEDELLAARGALLLPVLITPTELVARLAERLDTSRAVLTEAEREVLLGVACRAASDAGRKPPFRLRPGLIAEILRFYDALRRNQKDIDAFQRLTLGLLEPGASYDRGAERLVRQTRFLAAAFEAFERRCAGTGADEHELRHQLATTAARRPYRHVILTVADHAFDPHGLPPADWDLLARIPGLERLDVVVTDTMLAGALHERMHRLLPGIEEVRFEARQAGSEPVLAIPPGGALIHTARDREEEIAGFARRVKYSARHGRVASLDRVALVVRQPLPYVYVAREVLRSAGIPCQLFDALPLVAEPYAAALDTVFSFVSSSFARVPAIALLRSPHFRFRARPAETGHYAHDPRPAEAGRYAHDPGLSEAGHWAHEPGPANRDRVSARDIAALDRALSEAGYLGEADALERLIAAWRDATSAADRSRAGDRGAGRTEQALRAAEVLQDAISELMVLRSSAPVAEHLRVLQAFLVAHEDLPGRDDPLRARELRARGAILGTLAALGEAYARFDPAPVDFDEVAALVRRWLEGQTFASRAGETGVHLVDAESARFGSFDHVQLAGLVDGEWPDRPRRNIFYSTGILRELGWPSESERLDGARAAFTDLVRLPALYLVVSTFTLEADSLVSPSPLVDALEHAGLASVEEPLPTGRIFEFEALGLDPVDARMFAAPVREWAMRRLAAPSHGEARFRGTTSPHVAVAYSLSALERYQDCPFKYFASEVLRLEEVPEDEQSLSPRARGRFIHEVFHQFFQAWDLRVQGTITSECIDEARELFAAVAEPLLSRLPGPEAALERTRLFGSAISVGIVDVVLGLEASRPVDVRERWLEYRLEGDFSLGLAGTRRIPLKGVADRIDLLTGNRLRIIDYKSGSAPNCRRALQVPIYALCAQERLSERDGIPWQVDEAAYVAFTGKRSLAPVVKVGGTDAADVLGTARARVLDIVDGIGRGEFPPRPHDPMICRYCAYAAVCRKDYVGDE